MADPNRFARIAAQLEALPPEMIEPVLADLPLGSIIQLARTGGPKLAACIEVSPAWGFFFLTQRVELQALAVLHQRLVDLTRTSSLHKWRARTELPLWTAHLGRHHAALRRAFAQPRHLVHWMWDVVDRLAVDACRLGHHGMARILQAVAMFLPADVVASLVPVVRLPEGQVLGKEQTSDGDRTLDKEQTFAAGQLFDEDKLMCFARAVCGYRSPTILHQLRLVIPYLEQAERRLRETKHKELSALKDLYMEHSSRLKEPLAPQSPRNNTAHVLRGLQRDAAFVLRYRVFGGKKFARFRFSFTHSCLVPYDWCLRLFIKILTQHPVPELADGGVRTGVNGELGNPSVVYPANLLPDLRTARDGLGWIHRYGGHPSELDTEEERQSKWDFEEWFQSFARQFAGASQVERLRQAAGGETSGESWFRTENTPWSAASSCSPPDNVDDRRPRFLVRRDQYRYLPHPDGELQWLTAFLKCCEWMEAQFPDVVREVKSEEEVDLPIPRTKSQRRANARKNKVVRTGTSQVDNNGMVIRHW